MTADSQTNSQTRTAGSVGAVRLTGDRGPEVGVA